MNLTPPPAELDLIICDIDGCLTPEASESFDLARLVQVANYNREAFTFKKHPPLTLCTGRPQPFTEAMCRLLQNSDLPAVAEHGAWLYHPGTNRYELDPAITEEYLEIIHQASRLLNQKYGPEGVTQQPGKSSSVSLFHPNPQYLKDHLDEIRDLLTERGWPLRVSMTWNYINCDLNFISKATGLHRFFEQTKMDPKHSAGIGDTISDLAIAENVAWFACPANACEDLKPYANYISPYPQTAGVLDILEQIKKRPQNQATYLG